MIVVTVFPLMLIFCIPFVEEFNIDYFSEIVEITHSSMLSVPLE